jgi:DNA-binding SARP family transcriptional activator/TolB-like protein
VVHLFGITRAADASGRPVAPRARKTRALLAILAMQAPNPVLRTQIIALLWSRREPEQARASLRQALHELQSSLGSLPASLLRADRQALALSDVGLWSDVGTLAAAGPEQVAALNLYRPQLLADLAGVDPVLDGWIAGEAVRLDGLACALAHAVLASGAAPAARARAAEHLVARDSADGPAWEALIAALRQGGDTAGAAAADRRRQEALAAAAAGRPATAGTEVAPPALAAAWQPRSVTPTARLTHPPHHAAWIGAATARGVRVGVLALRALGGGGGAAQDTAALAAGLSEELVGALARFRGISCIPLDAQGPLSEESAPDPGARDPDLDFLLDGLIQCSGDRLRVTLRLLDRSAGGEVAWAARFDRRLENLLTLQDEIAGNAVARLESRLLLWQERRGGDPPDPMARRLLREALPGLLRLDRRAFERAGELLEAARRLDPEDASVHAWLAHWHLFAVGQGWAAHPERAGAQLRALVDTAVALDPEDARGLALAAHVRGFADHDATGAALLHARAHDANPNLPMAWSLSGLNEAYLGRYDEAIRRAQLARKLSPHDPLRYFFDVALAVPYLLRGENAESIRLGNEAIAANPGFSSAYKTQLAALGESGEHAAAEDIRRRLLALEPGFTVSQALERSPIQDPEGRARYAEGLRRGGLE